MKRELQKSLSILRKGKIILYPTDTVWGLGCDATDENAVKKIFKIKQRAQSKSLIVLVNDFEMLQDYIDIPSKVVRTLLKESNKPLTIIYKNPRGLAQNVISSDNTVAIRIVKDEFCQELINLLAKPIVSTSANISGSPTPQIFNAIEVSILESVDYVVDLNRDKECTNPSKIIRLDNDGSYEIIRN